MRRILFPVRTDRDTEWVVSHLVRLHEAEPVFVHLLSVHMPYNGHVRLFFPESQLEAFYHEDANQQLAPVRRALDFAGVPYTAHVEIGYSAQAIADFARQYHFDKIIMGPARGLDVTGLVLGSLKAQVERLLEASGAHCEVL
jgi:nucleotide-binding universal stress UspA family protein